MIFKIEKLPDEPILVIVHESKQLMQDMPQSIAEFSAALDAQTEPVFVVMDIRGLGLGLDDIPQAASIAALKPDSLLHHPMLRESLIVTKDGLLRLAAQGMRTATFGNVKLRVFATPEQAIEYCRERIAAQSQDAGEAQAR